MRRLNLLHGPDRDNLRVRRRLGIHSSFFPVQCIAIAIWGSVTVMHVWSLNLEIAALKSRAPAPASNPQEDRALRSRETELAKQLRILDRMSVNSPVEAAFATLGRTTTDNVVLSRLVLTESINLGGGRTKSGPHACPSDYDARFEGTAVDNAAVTEMVRQLSGENRLRQVRLVESDMPNGVDSKSRRFVISAAITFSETDLEGGRP
jgi:hypothetical protein